MSKEKKLVPKLRFEEFENDEEWVTYELGDISDVTKLAGFEYTKYVIYSEIGSIIALRGLNIKNGKIILDDVKYIDRSDFSKLDRSKLYQGDILLTYVGTIGNLAVIPENDKYYLAPNVARIRLTAGINPEFVTQRMGSQGFYRKIINPLIATSSQPALSMLNIRKFTLKIPGYKEQVKIGSHLNKLDEMIQLQQSKVSKVKDIKSAYLSEMFPKEGERYPKKRFEGFTKPWQLFKLGELGQFKSNGVNKKIRANDNPAYLLNYMDVYNKLSINQMNYKDLMKVTATSRELQENNIMKNDVFFTPTSETADDIGRVLTLEYDLPETVYSYHLIRFRPFEDKLYSIFPNYGFATKYLRKQMEIAAQGVQRFVISVTAFKDLKVYLPSYEEQIKIANFFKNLDNQISIEEEKLVKLEKLKQAYLNDMFV